MKIITRKNTSRQSQKFISNNVDVLTANATRVLAVEAVQSANSGHPGLPLGAADIVTVLWSRLPET